MTPALSTDPSARRILIIGGGPAGLTAAVELARQGWPVTVIEKDRLMGGIARTETYNGYRFDIGGHRFFTKIGEVNQFWHDILGPEFIVRPRISRIFYEGKFYDYPLKAFNALFNLGFFTSVTVVLSYIQSQLFPYPKEESFEEWVSNRFGKKLYHIFFKTYTEKVWGIPCSEIRAEWAAQRIQGLSLPVAIKNALFGAGGGKDTVKTLIEHFEYPRLGPGQMWEKAAEFVTTHGGQVWPQTEALRLHHMDGRVHQVTVRRAGQEETLPVTDVVSSMPIAELIEKLEPTPPAPVVTAAHGLTYRDFLTVVLIVKQRDLFPDNWIYIHSPEVKVGRIQNFKNWSPEMVPDPALSSLGLEYFCNEGDDLWQMADADLIALGKREMGVVGLINPADVVDGTVVRQQKAYPVYNSTYGGYLQTIKHYLANFTNLQTIGRNGLHKYNNQDHSMLTAMLAAKNVLGETHDVWEVNTERSYHEEVRISPAVFLEDELDEAQ